MPETDVSISELARQVSQEAKRLYRYLGEDLDRRVGAALGISRVQDCSLPSRPLRSASHASDEDKRSALEVLQEWQSMYPGAVTVSDYVPTVKG